MTSKSGPNYTRVRWVKSKERQKIALWFESLGYRVTIWSAQQDDKGTWEILYVPDDRVAKPPPVEIDLDKDF